MNKRIRKKIAKRKQNEEFVEWVKAVIGSRMADALLADWTRSMFKRESDACNYIFRRNNNE